MAGGDTITMEGHAVLAPPEAGDAKRRVYTVRRVFPDEQVMESLLRLGKLADLLPKVALLITSAARAADALVYLAELDQQRFGDFWLEDEHHDLALDDAFFRWACTSAVTALDQLAGAIARQCALVPHKNGNEYSLRDLKKASSELSAKAPQWNAWRQAVEADHRYQQVLGARKSLVHSEAEVRFRSLMMRKPQGHSLREQHQLPNGPIVAARPIIEAARDLTRDHVGAFLQNC